MSCVAEVLLAASIGKIDPLVAVIIFNCLNPIRPERLVIPQARLNLRDMSDARAKKYFRFTIEEINILIMHFKLPGTIITRERYAVPALEALCILLRRLTWPARITVEMLEFFGRSGPALSAIVMHMVQQLHDKYKSKIAFDREHIAANAATFAERIQATGCPLANCFAFIDGTCRPCARPVRNQRIMYSGHKKVHGLKFQSVITPDGIIVSLFGPVEGRRHDLFLLKLSQLEARLSEMPQLEGFLMYGDQGYRYSNHIAIPFACPKNKDEERFNALMTQVRISVEHGFGRIVNEFQFLNFKIYMKILEAPVGAYYLVAAFLLNCQSCLRGTNPQAEKYSLSPPSLENYLQID